MKEETLHPLEELGFTALEAEVYELLLREAPATGYAVARHLGKPGANVYKALESLETKGAVVVDRAKRRIYRPVPPTELLSQLDRLFAKRRERAKSALEGVAAARRDDGIYRMSNPEQVLERCRTVVGAATFALLVDGDAPTLRQLQAELETAASRGVHVVIKAYSPFEVAGARVILRPNPQEIVSDTPGTFFSIAMDGSEFLLARLSHEGAVQEAIWTASPMLAFQGYMGLVNELTLTAIMRRLEEGASIEEVRETFEKDRFLHPTSSRNAVYQNLLRALGHSAATDTEPDR